MDPVGGQGARVLSAGAPLPLAAWHADPIPPEEARRCRRAIQALGPADVALGVREMIARFFAGEEIAPWHRMLRRFAATPHERALVELVYGQLLMSVRLAPAREQLERGFAAAAHLLSPRDYFAVRARHARLAELPLFDAPRWPAPLADLLDEAAVVRMLRGARPARDLEHDRRDTVG